MMAEEWQDKRPVTILTVMHDNIGMVEQRQAGKQGNQSRNQSLSLTTTKVLGVGVGGVGGQNGPAAYILPYHAPLSEGV